MPVVNFRVYLTNGLIEEGLAVDPGVEHGGEGCCHGKVGRGGELRGLNAAEAVGAGDGSVFVGFSKEVKDPARDFRKLQ